MATEHLQWGVSPLCWTNDVLEDLGGDIPPGYLPARGAGGGLSGH